jgi:hypothetical protein
MQLWSSAFDALAVMSGPRASFDHPRSAAALIVVMTVHNPAVLLVAESGAYGSRLPLRSRM